jgi:hypothetical protein
MMIHHNNPTLRKGEASMKKSSKTNSKTNGGSNGNGAGPILKFNYVKRETLPQTRIDVRALEMIRGYPLYVKELTEHEPPLGEVLEQCIITTLSNDANFIEWLERQPRAELTGEQNNNSTSSQSAPASSD